MKLLWFFFNTETGFLFFLGPLSVGDRFPEPDDDVDVDVEQCSDSEAPVSSNRTSNKNRSSRTGATSPTRTTGTPSDEERLTPEPAQVIINIKQKTTKRPLLQRFFQFLSIVQINDRWVLQL